MPFAHPYKGDFNYTLFPMIVKENQGTFYERIYYLRIEAKKEKRSRE
jgi:hypothetical protein